MLISCPRCGFRQPKDQYCASCGVDMQAFKPLQPPLLKRIFGSTVFQFSCLAVLGVALTLYLVNFDRPQKWVQRITRYQAVKSKAADSAKSSHEQESEDFSSEASDSSEQHSRTNVVIESDVPADAFAAANTQSAAENSSSQSRTTSEALKLAADEALISVTFIEVSRETLAQWIQDSQSVGLYQSYGEDFSAGILPQFRRRSDLDFKVITGSTTKLKLGKTEPTMYGKTQDGSSQFAGMQLNLSLRGFENQSVKGHFELIRQLGEFKDSLPTEFELAKDTALFLQFKSLLAPFMNDRNLASLSPFDILKSVDYQNQKTELIIVLEPK